MKYSKEERLLIGKEVYEKRLGMNEAAVEYGINKYTVRDYYREYKALVANRENNNKSIYTKYSRQELIDEIMDLKVRILISEGVAPVEIVHTLRGDFPVSTLCKRAGITKTWYYAWLKKKSST